MSFDKSYHTFIVETQSAPNADGVRLITNFDYYWQFGVQRTKTNPRLETGTAAPIIKQQNIDGLGRVIETLGPDPSNNLVALRRSSIQSDQHGVYQEILALLDWTESRWRWQRHYVDGLGRVYKTVVLGPDGKTPVIVDKRLDSRNNWTQKSLPYYEGSEPAFVARSFDSYDRLVEEVKPVDGGRATTAWK